MHVLSFVPISTFLPPSFISFCLFIPTYISISLLHFVYLILGLFVFLALQPLWLYFHSPVAGFSLLVFEVLLITHSDAPQSIGLLWTSDQSVAETST
jgi:hypothetical protein